MAIVDLVMPKMGESIMEATVLKWLKKPGDIVKEDETVLEIATDKVDSEVPSTTEGVVEEILFEVNDVVPVGAVIAKIRTEKNEQAHPGTRLQPPGLGNQEPKTAVNLYPPGSNPQINHQPPQQVNKFYSPLVLNIASSDGISMPELESIPGTGNEGRVTKKDILQFVADRKNGRQVTRPQERQAPAAFQQEERRREETTQQFPSVQSGNVEIIEMDR